MPTLALVFVAATATGIAEILLRHFGVVAILVAGGVIFAGLLWSVHQMEKDEPSSD